jgi:hypothetical protein
LFRQIECAWAAVAAQIERTDDLLAKMRAKRLSEGQEPGRTGGDTRI